MAVSEQTPYIEYTANGSTNNFALEFDCENQDHLIVLVDDIEPVVGTWSLSNGSVVFGTAPASGKKITIQRNTPFRRDGDFQSYDNSFRPGPVNKGFDWVWLKLQELGVADWILSNRIDALRAYVDQQDAILQDNIDNLKNYVDDKDDELRAYLMEEIRKQGVALDQLEDYYNYLMQQLAQIAINKGWDASFVNYHGITQEVLNDGLNSYADMLAITNPKIGMRVHTKSYHSGFGYGGAEYIYNGAEWDLQPNADGYVSIEQFGAKCGDKPAAIFNIYPVETTDNTNAVKSAFTYALNNGLKLIAENNKCFFFENIDSLQFYGDVECDFNGALFFYSVALATDKKLYKFFQVSGMRKRLANLEITCNGYMGHGIDFNKSLSDNQSLTVEKLRVYNCRWGKSVLESECINRIRFVNCDFTSNYFAGINAKSFDVTWGHSAPVFYRDCIVNGNGPQAWILNTDAKYNIRTGGTISVRDTPNDVGHQAYFKGFSGLHWLGGQISSHGGGRNSSLATFKNCNMVTLDAFDLEDIDCFSLDGTALTTGNYTTYTNEASGAAIVADACVSISVRSPNLFGINAPAVLKLMNNPASYDYQVATPLSGFAFTVWDISSPVNGFGVNNIHPYALVYGESVSPIAFANAATKESVSSVIHHEQGSSDYTVNWPSLKTLWQNGNLQATVTDGYLLKYLSDHDQALVSGTSGHLYNEFIFPTQPNGTTPSDYAKWIFLEFTHGQSSDGRLVVQCLDAANAILASSWSSPSENSTHYPVSGWFRLKIPTGTKKIRYGFVNSANYNGAIRQHFWGSGTPRCNDWHFSVYIVHDGNGAMRNKARTNYSACVDEYRNRLIHQANTVAANTVNLAGAATLADVIAAVNALAASDNAVKTTLKNAGVIKTT